MRISNNTKKAALALAGSLAGLLVARAKGRDATALVLIGGFVGGFIGEEYLPNEGCGKQLLEKGHKTK